jgi:uncharacterized membrane protein (DUF4010 family)
MERMALVAVPIANLVPLARIALLAAVVAPGMLGKLAPALGAALVAGLAAIAGTLRRARAEVVAPLPEMRNPAQIGTALRFAALYGVVLLLAAWLSDLAGSRGLYAAALASGLVEIDAITLTALNLFGDARIAPAVAATAIALAFIANAAFKLGVLFWFNRRLAWRTLWPLAAAIAAGAAALALA